MDIFSYKLGEKNGSGSGDSMWERGTGENSVQTKGSDCSAKGESSVAEGYMSFAGVDDTVEDWREGKGAHAEGGNTTAAGNFSHTEGNSTVTNNPYEHAEGHFNYSHYSQPVYPDLGNTIHSIGIGSNLENRKNAWEVMQNGDAYLIGIGGYDGTNPGQASTVQEVLSGGSSFISVVKDSALHYENQGTDEESWFEARIPQSLFPADFLSSKGKYNLFVIINGEEEGTILGYTANHFCLQIGSDGSFFALCYDAVTDMDITHKVSIFKQPSQPSFVIQYTGLLGGSRQLPEEGSTVSIYLQRLF